MKTLKVFFLISAGMLSSCNSDEPVLGSESVTDFPLEVGNSWVYTWSTDDEDFPQNLRNRTVRITVTGRDEINGIQTYKTETTSDQEPELTSIHHYHLGDNKLSLLAYKISAISDANARISSSPNQMFDIFNEGMLTSQDLIIEDPPRIVCDYPLEVGKSWTHWERNDVELIRKEVTDLKKVTVPAGTFVAYKIEYGGPFHEDFGTQITDYVSSIGLVKRTISLNITLTDEVGNVVQEKHVNISVELKEFIE